MTETTSAAPSDDLQRRCAESIAWQQTGVLEGEALRTHANKHWPGHHDALQMAERDTTTEAMQFLAKWGTQPTGAGVPDDALAAIYRKANGEDTGKAQPLTTQRIFKAMRAAMLAASPPPPVPQTVAREPLSDEQCDAIYEALDSFGRDVDHYEYGLPYCMIDGETLAKPEAREVIRQAAHGIVATQKGDKPC